MRTSATAVHCLASGRLLISGRRSLLNTSNTSQHPVLTSRFHHDVHCNHEAERGIRRAAEAAGGNDCNRKDSEVAEVAAGGTTGRGSRRTKVVGGGDASVWDKELVSLPQRKKANATRTVAEGRIAGAGDTPEAPNRAGNKTSLEGKKERKLGDGNPKRNTGSGVRRSEATQIGCRLSTLEPQHKGPDDMIRLRKKIKAMENQYNRSEMK